MSLYPEAGFPADKIQTLVELLHQRAACDGDKVVYRFIEDDESTSVELTYKKLDQRARAIASRLQRLKANGERILLLFPPGLDFIEAFFGCLYAGAVAVPAYPPRLNRSQLRLNSIIQDVEGRRVLCLSPLVAKLVAFSSDLPQLKALDWIEIDSVEDAEAGHWVQPEVSSTSTAFLQYTSGSTSSPKGVMLSHANLLANAALIHNVVEHSAKDRYVSWLPMFHDMGFMAGVLQPLYAGIEVVLMSPAAFLQRPLRWLKAISQYKGTTSGGPNFAFDLCVRKIKEEERADLDLSTWTVAFNGAEPVRAETIDNFAKTFEPCGFKREVFFPCYGLAEATLMVSGGKKTAPPVSKTFSAKAIERGRIEEKTEGPQDEYTLVGCGKSLVTQEIAIIDPTTHEPCSPGNIGEIWVNGPSIGAGYWAKPIETDATFGATPKGRKACTFLRTGDLGFLADGELFVVGRLKDLIVIRGLNYYPQDIEKTVEKISPLLRAGCGAAFAVTVAGAERVVVVQEAERTVLQQAETVISQIRTAVAQAHDVALRAIVLIKKGTIPKTSSGKIQRRACREAFLQSQLSVLESWQESEVPSVTADVLPHPDERPPSTAQDIEAWLLMQIAAKTRVADLNLPKDQPIVSLGIDSLQATELVHAIEEKFNTSIPVADLLEDISIEQLAAHIHGTTRYSVAPDSANAFPVLRSAALPDEIIPLSHGQQALWFQQRLSPDSAVYNIFGSIRLLTPFDESNLRKAFGLLISRHAALRTVFAETSAGPVQMVRQNLPPGFRTIDVMGWEDSRVSALLQEEAHRSFDLQNGPLMRIRILNGGERGQIMLLVLHHIIADFWSLEILVRELFLFYRNELKNEKAEMAPVRCQLPDVVRWQQEMLKSSQAESECRYWLEQLDGAPVLDLPVDHAWPAEPSYQAANLQFVMDEQLSERIRAVAQECAVTQFAVLFSAFQLLLQRYSNQDDIVVGTPVSGRTRADFAGSIGYFINPLAIRTNSFSPRSYPKFVKHVAERLISGFGHEHYPFPLIVEKLHPERSLNRPPIFQAMFASQKGTSYSGGALAAVTSGQSGLRAELEGIVFETVSVEHNATDLDLVLTVSEVQGRLAATMKYRRAIFEAATIERMAGHYQTLLNEIAHSPERDISELPLLQAEESRQLLLDWNQTKRNYPDKCAHELFEDMVGCTPEEVAVVFGQQQLTYAALNSRANQLAHLLRRSGIGPESVVGICLERSSEMLVALLAILKAGGMYLPLDPAYPQERINFMLGDSAAPLVITQQRLTGRIQGPHTRGILIDESSAEIDQQPTSNLNTTVSSANLAYVIYTSGSTGKPKGVQIPHSALINILESFRETLKVKTEDTLLAVTSLSFDIAALELFLPIMSGARVVVALGEQSTDPKLLADVLSRSGASILQATPVMWRSLIEAGWHGDPHLRVLCGGEALPVELAHQLHAKSGSTLNVYGPTETTIWSLMHEIKSPGKTVPIGRPLANTSVYVLNANMQPAPVGVPGELMIGGAGLARGYANRPDLTAEKFVANPFSQSGGERLYKTGDLARWTQHGNLEFLGRIDHQVKIRGYRIELGEIEAVLEQHDRVKQAVVVPREYKAGDKRLVAYVVTDSRVQDSDLSTSLRIFAKAKVPEYMVPGVFVQMESLPRTANGKIDRRNLPLVALDDAGLDFQSDAPRTPVEEMLVHLWQEVLGVQRVRVQDNFFELGGHSLLATQLISRIRELRGVELPLKAIFSKQTITELARHIEFEEREQCGAVLPPLFFARHDRDLPLSYGQQRLWFLEQLEKGISAYHISAAVRLQGPLDQELLEKSFTEVIRRHEILRTTFPSAQGRAIQVVHGAGQFHFQNINLEYLHKDDAETRLKEALREEEQAGFDLTNGPLIRGILACIGIEEHVLQITMHHIISDGWSMGILVKEVAALYRSYVEDKEFSLPDLKFQFTDYAVWQREWVESGAIDGQRAYWKRQLADLQALQLPADHLRGKLASPHGRSQMLTTSREFQQQLKKLSYENNATLFMTLVSVFHILLWRYTGQTDIAVGTPVAGRNFEDVEKLIGFFVNTLVLRIQLDSGARSFRDLLDEVRRTSLEAFANQDVPFEKLVEDLQPERSLSQTPLFQVMFVMQNAPLPEMDLGSVRASRVAREELAAQFDLVLEAAETAHGLSIVAKYRAHLFRAATIQRLLGHYCELLGGVIANAQQPIAVLPLLQPDERQQVLYDWNQTEREYPSIQCIHELFERQVVLTPEATAIEFEGQQLRYRELNEKANQLGHQLRKIGVRAEVRVAVCMERSLELMIGLMGTMKAGGAYVPLDPSHPTERLSFMLADAESSVVLTQERLLSRLPASSRVICLDRDWNEIAKHSDKNLNSAVDPVNSIYVIYTSGSTGRPKGAINTHEGVRNRLLWMQKAYCLGADDRVLQKTSSSFDVSVWEFFWPLITGSALIMARPGGHRDSRYLAEVITTRKITTLHFVPSMLNAFLQDGGLDQCFSLRNVISSGEALSAELQERFFAHSKAELHNLYGPTEAAVDVSFWRCERGRPRATVPIGRPIANIRLYILDAWMEPAPIGVAGELYIAGIGLARGYLNRPELTAERFIANSFASNPGDRLYKTGDLARWQADGTIEYLGRTDHQVKVRGLRIELGEIEAVLEQHKTVKQAVVRVREDRSGDRRLVAYVVSHSGTDKSSSELRQYLKEKLPEYMVPASFVHLNAFPLNANGKIDSKALPSPEQMDSAVEGAYVAPRTAVETLIAEIWMEVLRVSRVGVHDNFFELGGDSILSIEIVARANRLGLPLMPRNMFEFQTIAELAQLAGQANTAHEQGRVMGEVPLTPIQKWFFEQHSDNLGHFNQAALLLPKERLDLDLLVQTVQALLDHHDALRMRFRKEGTEWKQENLAAEMNDTVQRIDLTGATPGREDEEISREAGKWQTSLDLEHGPLFRVILMQLRDSQRLLIVCHHLIIDGVSWRILLQDLEEIYTGVANGKIPHLGAKTSSFKQWAEALQLYASSDDLLAERDYWNQIDQSENKKMLVHGKSEENLERWSDTITYRLSEEDTRAILQEIPGSHKLTTNELLLAAFTQGMSEASGLTNILVDLEGHGREPLHTDMDVTRTIGWFTSLYPVRLQASDDRDWNVLLQRIKAQIRELPRHGLGYGVLRHLTPDYPVRAIRPEIVFNYLGQLDHALRRTQLFKGPAAESYGALRSPGFMRPYLLEVNGGVLGGQLYLSWTYGTRVHQRRRIEHCAESVQAALHSLIQHCSHTGPASYSPYDFSEVDLSQEEVDTILAKMKGVSA